MNRFLASSACALLAGLALSPPALADGPTQFLPSAVEHADGTVTLPVHRGSSHGDTVWYVVLDASEGSAADRLGANTASKLRNAASSSAVQRVRMAGGVVDFPATVDFSFTHRVEAPDGFPPAVFDPGARGEGTYSPLIRLPDGTILNAPQIARDQDHDGTIDVAGHTESADKVLDLDTVRGTVTYRETRGFARGNAVRYVSTDATDELAAALEDATYAPALGAAPFAGGDGTDSARASLAAFVNGRTGATNPQRQGLNSAVADGLDPLNILAWRPTQGRYSPLWDVHLAQWSAAAVAAGANTRQTEFDAVEQLAENGTITGPGGAPFRASGFIVDCPIVSQG